MSETTEAKEQSKDTTTTEPVYTKQIVKVGYDGERRPVKFDGKHVLEDSTHTHTGPNQNRWHEFDLYEVQAASPSDVPALSVAAKYRVLDHYRTCWQNESGHWSLSKSLTALQVMKEYPHLGAAAISAGIFDVDTDAEELAPDQAAPAEE